MSTEPAPPSNSKNPTPPKAAAEESAMQYMEGTLERLTFQNEENGYTVARVIPKGRGQGKNNEVTVVGALSGVNVGEMLHLEGHWSQHPQYGRQFEVQTYSVHYPATIEGLRKYLGSGLVSGVGPATANRIVDHFGLETLDIIENTPDRLNEVPRIGSKRVKLIQKAWQDQKLIKEVMIFLQGNDISSSLAVRIFKQYGQESIKVVQETPYRLAREVYGIGFRTADKIAVKIGLAKDDPQRIQAGLLYALSSLSDDGHCYATRAQLLAQATELLEVELGQCESQLETLILQDDLIAEDEVESRTLALKVRGQTPSDLQAIYLPPFYKAERGVTSKLRHIQLTTSDRLAYFQTTQWDRAFEWLKGEMPIQLTTEQQAAVKMALTQKVSVLTGGPGTGKSTITASILRLLQARSNSVLLAAPTGRAAKRLSETTGVEAKTIHRLLEFKPSGDRPFMRDRKNPLDADLVIIDESSMIDVLLMNHLLDAIDSASHLLLVGDVDQLPSVGAGNVLRDVINSEMIPVTRLNTIFRQAEDSFIIVNAHRINQGEMPLFEQDSRDFFIFPHEDAQAAADRVIEVVTKRIPARFAFNPQTDIQVLCPMHRGLAGVQELNARLQEALNPKQPAGVEIQHGSRVFRAGDRVMQVHNDYDRQIFNGDMGRILSIDSETSQMVIDFDDRPVIAEFSQLDEIVHAYAVSIHKSQGSEFPVVVIPLLTQHYMMLQRNLLYTAVTRARKLVVLIGSKRAIGMAIRNNRIGQRNTQLAKRLQVYVIPPEKSKGYSVHS